LVPVIYHDFVVSMAIKSKTDILEDNIEMIQIPLKEFSIEQLQKLKVKIHEIIYIAYYSLLITFWIINVTFKI